MRGILVTAGAVGLAAGGLVAWPGLLPGDAAATRSLAAGALLGTAGSIAAFLLLVRNLRAGHGQFLIAYFGGMLGRWALFVVVLALVILGGVLPLSWFLVGLIPSYLGFQAGEMVYLHRRQRATGPSPAMEHDR